MIELKSNTLVVSFPELRYQPEVSISFQRTLRIPDDDREYPLPPGLGRFPLRHIDDYARGVPRDWLDRGGVLLPMWQSEAMWLSFNCKTIERRDADYPFAIKVATGKISAITGERWAKGLRRQPQNYLVAPEQPWLDGYCVEQGIIRQFVAMPLGQGYSAEEQLTGKSEFGGLQIEVFPLRTAAFEKHFPIRPPVVMMDRICCMRAPAGAGYSMGLAPGGRMRQEIYEDPFSMNEWDLEHSSRCFIHIVNSNQWRAVTGEQPPSEPLTAAQYTNAGFPWFDYYQDEPVALPGAARLAGLKSVNQKTKAKGKGPLPDNQSIVVSNIVNLGKRRKKNQVREADIAKV